MNRSRSRSQDARNIIDVTLRAIHPRLLMTPALGKLPNCAGRILLLAFGKAAWSMASVAREYLGDRIDSGICITKHGHVMGNIPGVRCLEAGHPVPDEHTITATQQALAMLTDLTPDDLVLVLISGGGSALFEDPLVPLDQLQDITRQLLASGAPITHINTIRKRLSRVKGGRLAQLCQPARVVSIIMSDVLGDPLDVIASGPTYPDSSTTADVHDIIDRYHLDLTPEARQCLEQETPKDLPHVTNRIVGNVTNLCDCAITAATLLGYQVHVLTTSLDCEARDAGAFMAAIARTHATDDTRQAWIACGETVVHVTGNGLGGRNQELALAAAAGIAGLDNVTLASVGSDGTDGPTEAAGAIVDGFTAERLTQQGLSIPDVLACNDSYHAHALAGTLFYTGPTGNNLNDLTLLLIN